MDKNELCKKIKNDINNLNQNEIEEIFKIIYKNNNIYTKTNAGVNINLSLLDIDILNQINNFIKEKYDSKDLLKYVGKNK